MSRLRIPFAPIPNFRIHFTSLHQVFCIHFYLQVRASIPCVCSVRQGEPRQEPRLRLCHFRRRKQRSGDSTPAHKLPPAVQLLTAFCARMKIKHNLTLAQAAVDDANSIDVDGRNVIVAFPRPQGASASERMLRVEVVCVPQLTSCRWRWPRRWPRRRP